MLHLIALLFSGIVAFVASTSVAVAEIKSSITYARPVIGDVDFGGELIPYDYISIYPSKGEFSSGHVVSILEPCQNGNACIDLGFVMLALPSGCQLLKLNYKWSRGDYKFKVSQVIGDDNDDLGQVRYAIVINNEKKIKTSVALYSYAKGIESFALVDKVEGKEYLVSYSLISDKGLFAAKTAADARKECVPR